jgi:ubiquinone/menaquinone biosynthesis C-methylase UbiE
MIRKAKSYLSSEQQKRTFLFVGDAALIPYKDNVMDAVFAFGVLHHVLDWRAALADIARVLKNNGLLFFEELYPSLYQNFITRRILLHPEKGRFRSNDLKVALKCLNFSLIQALELKKLGIVGVSVKRS